MPSTVPTSRPAAGAPAPPPPRLRAPWPGAFAFEIARSPLGFVCRVAEHGGDVVRVRAGGRTIVVVVHPDLAREVLVTQQKRFTRGFAHRGLKLVLGEGLLTSEDPLHRRQRRVVQPAFHRERIAGYARAMVAAAARWDGQWAARWEAGGAVAADGAPGVPVDAAAEMSALTLGIAGETLFGARVEGASAEVAEALSAALKVAPLAFVPWGGRVLASPLPVARRFRRARARLDAVVLGMIAERRRARARATDDQPDDLLAMLLDATDPEAEGGDAGPMSDAQLRDEVMTLFLAGHETTASALAWTWHLLSAHPDAQARLHAELDAVLTDAAGAPRLPTFDDLPRLRYARMVLSESMRLYPPAYAIGRICVEATTLGGCRLEPGWGVLTSPWLAHRDARWWPDPLRFDPERWAREDPARPRSAYFPFGGGSRICIGEQFAWTEATLVLAALARRWAVRPAPRTRGGARAGGGDAAAGGGRAPAARPAPGCDGGRRVTGAGG
jgi:cytochrome P450